MTNPRPMSYRSMVLLAVAAASLARGPAAHADEMGDKIRGLTAKLGDACVAVKITYESDDGERREFEIPGMVIAPGGMTLFAAPDRVQQLPRSFFKKFEILRAEKGKDPIAAKLVSFDSIAELAFVEPTERWGGTGYFDIVNAAEPPPLGDPVLSIGLLPEPLGRRCCFQLGRVGPLVPEDAVVVTPWPSGFEPSAIVDLQGRFVATTNLAVRMPFPGSRTARLAAPVKPAVEFVLKNRKDRPEPWLGVAGLAAATREIREFYKVPDNQPAIIVGSVVDGFPAEKAGLKAKDLIVALDDKPLEEGATEDETRQLFTQMVKKHEVGEKLKVAVWRDDKPQSFDVVLAEMPMTPAKAPRAFNKDVGLAVRQIVFQDVFDRKLPLTQPGVIVDRLVQSGPADTAGVEMGDIVRRIQDKPVENIEDYEKVLKSVLEAKPREFVVSVLRGTSDNVVVRIELSRAAKAG